jgi:lipopolysaccharide/colanic/teichoic acid biosynthesis glycosyltransferase
MVLLPLLLILFVLVRLWLGKPALFRQVRTGKNGELFQVVKFRSMTNALDNNGKLLDDGARLTRFGAFLRASSLDELPQLWNVARGDMSLVGPRPLLPAYLPRYSARQRRRHDVKPGITGLAQISGRNAISWDEKLELDVRYASNVTLGSDLAIAWKTVAKVLGRHGVSREGHVTAPEFMGTEHQSDDSTGNRRCAAPGRFDD